MVIGEDAETELRNEILLQTLPQRLSFATISSLPSPLPLTFSRYTAGRPRYPAVGTEIHRVFGALIFGPSWLSLPDLVRGPDSVTIFERTSYLNGV